MTGRAQPKRTLKKTFNTEGKDYEYGFSFDAEPPCFSSRTVLKHKGKLEVEIGSYPRIGPDFLKISENIELKVISSWDKDVSVSLDETKALTTMTREEVGKFLKKYDKDIPSKYPQNLAELPEDDFRKGVEYIQKDLMCEYYEESIFAESKDGTYSLDDLAKIIYYSARMFDYNEHELVYEIALIGGILNYYANT